MGEISLDIFLDVTFDSTTSSIGLSDPAASDCLGEIGIASEASDCLGEIGLASFSLRREAEATAGVKRSASLRVKRSTSLRRRLRMPRAPVLSVWALGMVLPSSWLNLETGCCHITFSKSFRLTAFKRRHRTQWVL
jgi:hypothetical protein